jgi:hypothetical protein
LGQTLARHAETATVVRWVLPADHQDVILLSHSKKDHAFW